MVGPLSPLASLVTPEYTAGRLTRSSVLGGRADIDGQIPEPRWILDGAPTCSREVPMKFREIFEIPMKY